MSMARSSASFLVILLGLVSAAGAGQDPGQLPIQVEAQSSDFDYKNGRLVFNTVSITQGEIRIVANRAQATGLDFQDSQWEFSGAVHISTTASTLDSDTAQVSFKGGEIASATVQGAPALFNQLRGEEKAQGRAERIDYDLGRGTVRLLGDAWLSDGRNEITGSTLVYSTANQRVIAQSAEQGGEPVRITIRPPAADKEPKP